MNINIEQLRIEVEKSLGRNIKTPRDFEFLRQNIYSRINILLSTSTLMRLWGYINEDVAPRISTLDTLARFIGFNDYTAFEDSVNRGGEAESNPVYNRSINVIKDLHTGDRLMFTWLPNRSCLVEYTGNLSFKIMESKNTRLSPGDTFQTGIIIEGEPLYLDCLCQKDTKQPSAYVCGKKNGINFQILKSDPE